jgi:hypothetical protein
MSYFRRSGASPRGVIKISGPSFAAMARMVVFASAHRPREVSSDLGRKRVIGAWPTALYNSRERLVAMIGENGLK